MQINALVVSDFLTHVTHYNRRVTKSTRRLAEFLVFRSLPPAVAGDRAPGGFCFNHVFDLG